MSSPAEEFVKKWKELMGSWEYHLPLDELLELTKNCTSDAVREGLTANPGLLHQLLKFFEENNEEDPLEMVEIVHLMLDSCSEAAGTPIPSDDDPNTLVYPLHEACQNGNTPSKVIELLLEKSTAGLDYMALTGGMGIIEWCGRTDVAGTPLHYALYAGGKGTQSIWGGGDVAIVKRLVEACPDALTMKDTTTHGLTPLHTVLRAPSNPDPEVVRYLVQCNTSLLRERDAFGQNPLHLALQNEYITLEVVEVLFESAPVGAWEMSDDEGFLPVQSFLRFGAEMTSDIEALTIGILKLFLRMSPSFFRAADNHGRMPIHHATYAGHGVKLCKMLVEIAPGCERVPDFDGRVPLYGACHFDTVKYLLGLYPESIYLQVRGSTPFHYALRHVEGKYKDDIIRCFLDLDPSLASREAMAYRPGLGSRSLLPLHTACIKWGYGCEWRRLKVVKMVFDRHPSAILVPDADGNLPVDLAKEAMVKEKEEYPPDFDKHKRTISFLETQHPFVADASDSDALNTPDENGTLLLHRALLEKDISLGTVKMIGEGTNHNAAMRGPNPLHLACANCSSDIIQYLSGVYSGLLNSVDDEGCNLLHIACKAGNLKAFKYLLEQHAPMATETNSANLLPIHILCDKSGKEEICRHWSTNTEYVGTIWQFLLAHPAVVSSAIDRNHRDTVC